MWQYLVKCEKLKAVDHKFPECGHSYMDSDRDFAHIEQKVREVSNVYDVDQYHNIMAQSQQKSKPQITRMQGKLYDVKTLPAALKLTHRKKTTDGSPVRFRDTVRWVRVEQFGSYMFRESFDEQEPWKTVNLLSDPASAATGTPSISDVCKLVSGHVKKAKIEDLKKQLTYIPVSFRAFYQDIIDKFVDNGVDLSDTNIDGDDCEDMTTQPHSTQNGGNASSRARSGVLGDQTTLNSGNVMRTSRRRRSRTDENTPAVKRSRLTTKDGSAATGTEDSFALRSRGGNRTVLKDHNLAPVTRASVTAKQSDGAIATQSRVKKSTKGKAFKSARTRASHV